MSAEPEKDKDLALLASLIARWEGETVEFKEASNDFDTDRIGRYVSALSNEANLRGEGSAWLVFGISNKTRGVVGTRYRADPDRLNGLKRQIGDGTNPSLTFRSIRVVDHPDGRVIMFEIPAAPQGVPISWKGAWYGRSGESLTHLSLDKIDAIRRQDYLLDWTAQPVEGAGVDALSPGALEVARSAFAQRNAPRVTPELVESWSDEEFLGHAGLRTPHGLNRACILLLGRPESAYLLSPLMAELTWTLVGEEEAYEHFTIPFLLATTELYKKIRNVKIRLVAPGELVQREIEKYDQATVLEAMHNCIAHQDYSRHSRIIVTEHPDRLEFVNAGSFFEGTPDQYAMSGRVPRQYRNPALVQAMTQLNMIDHLGFGIERMNRSQAGRYLPLPDYDLSDPHEVKLTIFGSVVDEGYTSLLMERTDLPFEDVLALDRVQKGRDIPDPALKGLRDRGLVEGRRPHLRVARSVAAATGTQAEYLLARGQTDEYCSALITDYLRKNGRASRRQLERMVFPALPGYLTEEQKKNKVSNLLAKMRGEGAVRFVHGNGRAGWTLA